MAKNKLIVIVSGGVVQDIIADRPTAIVLVDHDNIREGDRPGVFPETVDPKFIRVNWARLRKSDLPADLI